MGIDHARVGGGQPVAAVIEPLMTADEVAAALGVNRKFVYARHHEGALRGYKLGPYYRFRPDDVRAFVETCLAPPDAEHRVRERPHRAPAAGTFRALIEGRTV